MNEIHKQWGLSLTRVQIDRLGLVFLVLMLCLTMQCAAAQAIQRTSAWQPDPPKYGYEAKKDIPVRMDDGIVLQADEYFPVHPATGAKGHERFPVLLAQTPYGKSQTKQNQTENNERRGYV